MLNNICTFFLYCPKKTGPRTVNFMDNTNKSKKPYYGKKTKRKVVEEYLKTSASMNELARLHGILGSNTASDWIRKYGNLMLWELWEKLVRTKLLF